MNTLIPTLMNFPNSFITLLRVSRTLSYVLTPFNFTHLNALAEVNEFTPYNNL